MCIYEGLGGTTMIIVHYCSGYGHGLDHGVESKRVNELSLLYMDISIFISVPDS